ncbi:MAG: membrane dipeptidase [Clostridia bacterium]|nr:membrane dipeptidase [Clostridia bacterium]
MKYFDLHCDTPYEIFRKQSKLDKNCHHVSLERADASFERYSQLAAYCAPPRVDDDTCYEKYLQVVSYFLNEAQRLSSRCSVCKSFSDLEAAEKEGKVAFFPTVEDARILAGKLDRLDVLYKNHCRFLTLVWGGNSCIGGAHDTGEGLTDFGRQTVRRCFELGIVPDVSHSSEQTVDDLIELAEAAKKPFIASHSNSYQVFSHSRNLRDRHFEKIRALGGIVGISLCDIHIQPPEAGKVTVDGVVRHIEHYMELGGERVVALGCDLDGCDLPDGFGGISDTHKIFDRLACLGYSDGLIENISYNNAREFIKRNL